MAGAVCARCGIPLRTLPLLPVAYPHVCRPKAYPLGRASTQLTSFSGGDDWAPPAYGEYYARSVLVYTAVKLIADALASVPLKVYTASGAERAEVPDDHPLSVLLRKVNPFWTRGDLWRGTATYLNLWGSAYWVASATSGAKAPNRPPDEIWLARPDRMRILPSRDPGQYIDGFSYRDAWGRNQVLRRDEVIWLRYFNPLEELAGFSPVAAARLSADMASDALRHNRNTFVNGMLWGSVALQNPSNAPPLTDDQVAEIQERLKQRYAKPENAQRPMILNQLDAKNLGFSQRDMEFLGSLRWSLEDVARAFNIPKIFLGDLERATYSNFDVAERILWRNTIKSLASLLEEQLNEMLCPQFGPDLEVMFDFSGVPALQPDADAVAARLRADVQAGVITVNEARTERGLEPVPWGDAWWAPLTLYPVSDDSAPPAPATPPKGLLQAPRAIHQDGYHRYEAFGATQEQAIAGLHERALGRGERRFLDLMRSLFDEQRRDVLGKLRSRKSLVAKQPPDLFDLERWIEQFVREARSLYIMLLTESAQSQDQAFGLGVEFNVQNPRVQNWLDARLPFWARRVNEETGRLLMDELRAGIDAGDSSPQMAERVEKVFRFNDAVRAGLIARTETQAAVNAGSLEAYMQSDVVVGKMWLATLDGRTRPDHLAAHRQVVPLTDDFVIGADRMPAPGQGPVNQVARCRCALAPVLKMPRAIAAPSRASN